MAKNTYEINNDSRSIVSLLVLAIRLTTSNHLLRDDGTSPYVPWSVAYRGQHAASPSRGHEAASSIQTLGRFASALGKHRH